MVEFSDGTVSVLAEVLWETGMARQILHEGATYFSMIFLVIHSDGIP